MKITLNEIERKLKQKIKKKIKELLEDEKVEVIKDKKKVNGLN